MCKYALLARHRQSERGRGGVVVPLRASESRLALRQSERASQTVWVVPRSTNKGTLSPLLAHSLFRSFGSVGWLCSLLYCSHRSFSESSILNCSLLLQQVKSADHISQLSILVFRFYFIVSWLSPSLLVEENGKFVAHIVSFQVNLAFLSRIFKSFTFSGRLAMYVCACVCVNALWWAKLA